MARTNAKPNGPAPGNTRSRRVSRIQLTEIQKRREKALIDAGVSKDQIAAAVRERHGTRTRRQQVHAVFRDQYRSIDLIEPIAAEMLGVPVTELFPDGTPQNRRGPSVTEYSPENTPPVGVSGDANG